tara:strand:+ start:1837 stop:1983 length:147 start_codon:yes stop_codon:yes gene_type:complete
MLTTEIIIGTVFCIVGAVWTSYKTGIRAGIEATLTQLEDAGVIEFDPE